MRSMTGSCDASKAQICDCGLFALAYATALCLGQNSQCLLFKQSTMRAHLLKCLEEERYETLPMQHCKRAWADCRIISYCDNQVVVTCLKPRTSKCKGVMHLSHCLFFIEARKCYYLHLIYIDTHSNYLANALSRNNLPIFPSKCPDTDPHPIPISLSLLNLLLNPSAD